MRREFLEKIIGSRKNYIISGEMSVGKTYNVGFGLVKKLIEKGENLFILDTNEEYINRYYKNLKEDNYNVIIINTKNVRKSDGWNPLNYAKYLFDKGDIDGVIKFLNSMVKELLSYDDSEDSFWSKSANDFLKGIILMLFNDALNEEINFNSISSLISDSLENYNYLQEYMRTKDINDPCYVCASSTVFSPVETRGGIISTAVSKINSLIRSNDISLFLNSSSYKFEDILEKKTAIFFIADEMDDISFLTSMYVKELFYILYENNNINKFNIILDNFDYINYMSDFENMLSLGIKYNIKFYIFTRSKEILEKNYGVYINYITDNILINEDKITLNAGDSTEYITNTVIKYKDINDNVDYPKLEYKDIKVFNLKKYILNNIKISDDNEDNYKDYVLELSDMKTYDNRKGTNDNPQRRAVMNNEASFYVIKYNGEIVDDFVIFNENNWLAIDNKKLLDVAYIDFILDNLKGYDYVIFSIPSTSVNIINLLKFNFDIDSIEDLNMNEYIFKNVKIKL